MTYDKKTADYIKHLKKLFLFFTLISLTSCAYPSRNSFNPLEEHYGNYDGKITIIAYPKYSNNIYDKKYNEINNLNYKGIKLSTNSSNVSIINDVIYIDGIPITPDTYNKNYNKIEEKSIKYNSSLSVRIGTSDKIAQSDKNSSFYFMGNIKTSLGDDGLIRYIVTDVGKITFDKEKKCSFISEGGIYFLNDIAYKSGAIELTCEDNIYTGSYTFEGKKRPPVEKKNS